MAGSAWTNQVQNQVIIAGSSGQLLVYSPTPGAGNLVSSISARAFTDPYGNAVLRGVVDYFTGVTATAVQLDAGAIFWYTAGTEAGPWTAVSELVQNLAGTVLTMIVPSLTISGPVNAITGIQPGTVDTSETWHAMSPLLNSWAAQAAPNVQPQYRLVASPPNTVEVLGSLNAAAATAITFFTLPAGYRPASSQPFPVGTFSGSAAINNVTFGFCDTSGNLTIQQRSATQTGIYFHGFISLDA